MSDPTEPSGTIMARHIGIDVGGTKTHVMWTGPSMAENETIVPTSDWARTPVLQDPDNLAHLAMLLGERVGDALVGL